VKDFFREAIMRAIIRAFLVLLLLVVIGFIALGYWTGSSIWNVRTEHPSEGVATSGSIDTTKARERGADVGEKAAIAAERVKETVGEAALTTKIKAKMALDDTIKARAIDVSTHGSTVTLSGTVGSPAERTRAVALTRETAGVNQVVDRLQVRQ
jgi:hyperosmotically inducible periplasmic protein